MLYFGVSKFLNHSLCRAARSCLPISSIHFCKYTMQNLEPHINMNASMNLHLIWHTQKKTCLGSTPHPVNSHHQDNHIFSREFLQTFICHCYWVWGRSKLCPTAVKFEVLFLSKSFLARKAMGGAARHRLPWFQLTCLSLEPLGNPGSYRFDSNKT